MDINKMKLKFGDLIKVTYQRIDIEPIAIAFSFYKGWLDRCDSQTIVGYYLGVHKAWMVLSDTEPGDGAGNSDVPIFHPRVIVTGTITNIQILERRNTHGSDVDSKTKQTD